MIVRLFLICALTIFGLCKAFSCSCETEDFESAIEYLEKVSFDDRILQYQTMGALGDVYVETEDYSKGLNLYKSALKKA